MDPIVARKTWRTVEPVHTVLYFAPESIELYEGLGFDPSHHAVLTLEVEQRFLQL